jgi:hypothetical protein
MWYREAGKVKYYFFNGESNPLRKMALNDDDVSRVLYEAAVGHLFPRYEDKR